MRVLLIEDEAEMAEALGRRLSASGHVVVYARTQAGAAAYFAEDAAQFDVIVLDRGLPDGDGLDGLGDWRSRGLTTPVLVLTAMVDVHQRVAGLERGADDYLGKPFAMAEFLARVVALGRRGGRLSIQVEHAGDLELDLARREVRRSGVRIPVRPKEYAVLELLLRRQGRVVTRDELRRHCWGDETSSSNVEETTVASLRRKLGSPALIHTRRGQGYILEVRDG
ncbi:MAG: response regulator transcription factor [Myxococcota bacterium]